MYTEVRPMTQKKTESITYRTDLTLKAALTQAADERKWTISFLSEEIIRDWLNEHYPELMNDQE